MRFLHFENDATPGNFLALQGDLKTSEDPGNDQGSDPGKQQDSSGNGIDQHQSAGSSVDLQYPLEQGACGQGKDSCVPAPDRRFAHGLFPAQQLEKIGQNSQQQRESEGVDHIIRIDTVTEVFINGPE